MNNDTNQTPTPAPDGNPVLPPPPAQNEVTVTPQPVIAPTPAVPQPAPVIAAAPGGQGKPKTGLIIGIAAGAVVLLGGLIAAALLLSGPTKDDYKKADAATQAMSSSYNEMGSVYISTSSTMTEVNNGVNKIKSADEKFNTQFTDLKSMKAISGDKDINKLYQAAADKKVKFDAATNAALEAYDKIFPVVDEIDQRMSSTSDMNGFLTVLSDVREKLEALSLNSQVNKDYVSALIRDIKKLEAVTPKVIAGKQDYTKYDSAAVNDFYDIIDSLSNDDRDWKSNMEKLQSEGKMKDELNNLENALYEKSIK